MIGTKHHLIAAWLVVGVCGALSAQEGSIDPTFNPTDIGFGHGDGANLTVLTVATQTDGKIIIGGVFNEYDDVNRNCVARLNMDGTLDTTFDPGTGAQSQNLVNCVILQTDGKIIVAGDFSQYNGVARNRIARLNTDGTLDLGFAPGGGANNGIRCAAIQPDGKIIVGGVFTSYNGTVRNRIARLNADGSLDTGFNPGTGASSEVRSTAIQADGKIIIGGYFTSYNGTDRYRIARLNANGSLDSGFDPLTGANSIIESVDLQPDGKILIAGSFTSVQGTSCGRIARLNPNGSIDPGFASWPGADATIGKVLLQSDGSAIIAGDFTSFHGLNRPRIARFGSDGSVDTGFIPGSGMDRRVHSVVVEANGKIIAAGEFTTGNGTGCGRIVRLNSNGTIDPGFNIATGANRGIESVIIQPDGNVLVSGDFTGINGVGRKRIARLHSNGALDTGFVIGEGPNANVLGLAQQTDGKAIVCGSFTTFNGSACGSVARLNVDGSVDATFNIGTGANDIVRRAVVQPDGKIILVGYFTTFNGTPRNRITRVNSDGTTDSGFTPGSGANGLVLTVTLQPDGKILIGGMFTSFNGMARASIARLEADGTVDASFDPGPGIGAPPNMIRCTALQNDGKIVVGGLFNTVSGFVRNNIARLNANGSLDPTFIPGSGTNTPLYSCVLQHDGKIMITGDFATYDGVSRDRVARINADGSLDATFSIGTGASGWISCCAPLADGKVIIGGDFTSYNGIGRNRIARINGTARSSIKLMLEGPYSGGQMNDALRTLPSFPLTEPFTALGYAETAFVPGASIPASLLSVTGNNAIVDWVIVEMRPVATPNVVAATRAVLLQRDGDVVDLDGVSTVGFAGLAAGSYCVAVKPRTHLPVMLSTSTPIIYGDAIATVDFTLPSTQLYDTDAANNIGGVMVLVTGDAVFNENLQYTGANNDRDPILIRIGGTVATATVNGYWNEDVNMDGIVKYTGANNDRDPILLNVGGSTPTVVRHAELP